MAAALGAAAALVAVVLLVVGRMLIFFPIALETFVLHRSAGIFNPAAPTAMTSLWQTIHTSDESEGKHTKHGITLSYVKQLHVLGYRIAEKKMSAERELFHVVS